MMLVCVLIFCFASFQPFCLAAKKPILWNFKEIVRDKVNPLPELTDQEKERGYLLFNRPEPGDIYERSIPLREEIVDRISKTAAKGEIADVHFAIHALRDLKNVRVTVAPFGNEKWVRDVRNVYCWSQRTDWSSSTFHVIPELLLKEKSVDIPSGATQQYYLRIYLPEEAGPGKYETTVTLTTADGESKPLTIELTVLPFKLLKPKGITFGLYSDTNHWPSSFDDDVKLHVMRKVREQGINAMQMYPLVHSKLKYRDGKLEIDFTEFNNLMELYKKAGLEGPFVMSIQGIGGLIRSWLDETVWVDEAVDEKGEFTNKAKDALTQVVTKIAEQGKKNNWPEYIFHAVDEPSDNDGEKMKEAVRVCKVIHDLGFKTFCTIWNPGSLDPYLDYRCYNLIGYTALKNEEITAKKRKETLDAGDVFWYYGTGCYVNGGIIQDGNIIANRFMGGFFLWRSKATGCWAWTFMRQHAKSQDPYNDFDGFSSEREIKDMMIVYPAIAPDVGFTPTLQWEGIRKGIDDYRYLYTLSEYIQKAKDSGQSKLVEQAGQIEKQLNQMIDSLPWQHAQRNQYPTGAITNSDMEKYRKHITDWIILLNEKLK